jgi:hypothetical protein
MPKHLLLLIYKRKIPGMFHRFQGVHAMENGIGRWALGVGPQRFFPDTRHPMPEAG